MTRTSPASSSASRSIGGGAAAEAGVRRVLVLVELLAGRVQGVLELGDPGLRQAQAAVEALLLAGEVAEAGVDGVLVVTTAPHGRQGRRGRRELRAAPGGAGAGGGGLARVHLRRLGDRSGGAGGGAGRGR